MCVSIWRRYNVFPDNFDIAGLSDVDLQTQIFILAKIVTDF